MNINRDGIECYSLELTPEKLETVLLSLKWYHESLHMLTEPASFDPELPLEQLDDKGKRVQIIRSHRLIYNLEEQLK